MTPCKLGLGGNAVSEPYLFRPPATPLQTPVSTCSQESYARCRAMPHFLPRFYDLFLGKGPQIAARFDGVDMERQQRMLRASLELVHLAATSGVDPGFFLEPMAKRHSRDQYDIKPALYADWLDALLTAAEECDPQFEEETRKAWAEIMMAGIRFMIARY